MITIPDADLLGRLRDEIERRQPEYLSDLETLVNIESGSYTKSGVDQVSTWMATRLQALGATVERHANGDLGDTVVATIEGPHDGPTVMLIGHADTVFDPGFLARRPFEIREGHILGPGTSDMKSGLLNGLYAIEALRAVATDGQQLPVARLIFVVNPDEEIGSPRSAPLIADLARAVDAAFVMEAARPSGNIVSARKGMMHIRATIHGRAAHAGVAPSKGRSATLEAAHKTLALDALNGRWPGVTVNVGQIDAGTRPNIVAEQAVMTIDIRARSANQQDEAEAVIYQILENSTVPDVTTTVERLARMRPMQKTPESTALVDAAVLIAGRLGFDLADTETGGASDANTTASVGVPSLDGLGPIGGNDHTPLEYMQSSSVVPRTTLLAALVASVGR